LNKSKIFKTILVSLAIFFAGRYFYNHNIIPTYPGAQNELVDASEKKTNPNNLKGKYVLVSYFQTWCGDCIAELPNIEQLQKHIGQDKLAVLLVSDENWEKITQFKQKRGLSLNFYQSQKPLNELGINVYPSTYLISPNGEVILAKLEQFNWYSPEVLALVK
jgi:peroxiredoxin